MPERKNRYKIDKSSLSVLDVDTRRRLDRSELEMLEPYFNYDKEVFLNTLDILYKDVNSDYTTFIAKPGLFKTDKQQEEGGLEFSPFKNNEFSVEDYLTNKNNLDWFGIMMRPIFYNKEHFNIVYKYYFKYFDKLKFNHFKNKGLV